MTDKGITRRALAEKVRIKREKRARTKAEDEVDTKTSVTSVSVVCLIRPA